MSAWYSIKYFALSRILTITPSAEVLQLWSASDPNLPTWAPNSLICHLYWWCEREIESEICVCSLTVFRGFWKTSEKCVHHKPLQTFEGWSHKWKGVFETGLQWNCSAAPHLAVGRSDAVMTAGTAIKNERNISQNKGIHLPSSSAAVCCSWDDLFVLRHTVPDPKCFKGLRLLQLYWTAYTHADNLMKETSDIWNYSVWPICLFSLIGSLLMKTLNLILSHTTEAMENPEGKSELYNSQRSFQTLPVGLHPTS